MRERDSRIFQSLLQQPVEPIPVRIIEEDRLPGVIPKDDMIDAAGEMYAGFTR
jgi:hypothetical protein